jgi:hypothetical protein
MRRLINPDTDLVKIGAAVIRDKLNKTKLTNFGKTSEIFAG